MSFKQMIINRKNNIFRSTIHNSKSRGIVNEKISQIMAFKQQCWH